MDKHIGIVDVTTLGTTLCQLAIAKASSELGDSNNHLQYSVHSQLFERYKKAMKPSGWDWQQVADLVLESISALQNIGANLIIIPNNTAHHAFSLIKSHSPLPILSIIDAVVSECVKQKIKTVGILGTSATMEGGLYDESLQAHGVTPVIPEPDIRSQLNDIILNELVLAQPNQERINALAKTIKTMPCEGYILGCTELPSVYNSLNLEKTCIDSTRALAQAAMLYTHPPT